MRAQRRRQPRRRTALSDAEAALCVLGVEGRPSTLLWDRGAAERDHDTPQLGSVVWRCRRAPGPSPCTPSSTSRRRAASRTRSRAAGRRGHGRCRRHRDRTLVDARTAAPLVAPRRPAPHPRHHPPIAAFGTGGARCVHRARQTARGQRVHRPQRRLRCRVHRARRSASKRSTGDRPAGVHARSVPAARSRSPAHPRIGRPVRSLCRPPDRPSRRPRRRHGDGRGAPPPAPCPAERWWRITRSAAGDAWRRGARDLATSPARRPRRPCRPAAAAVRASAR